MKDGKYKNKQQGFTLFELLVSISIIAVMTAIAVVSFGGMNKKSRDARRTADLEKIRTALELAKQIGTTYPSSINYLVTNKFLDKEPVDPKSKAAYTYRRDDPYNYYICATMEDIGSTNNPVGMTGCNYQVINP